VEVHNHGNMLKQIIVSGSTIKEKIVALENLIVKTKILKNYLYDLSLLNKSIPLISMHCNSQIVIYKVFRQIFSKT